MGTSYYRWSSVNNPKLKELLNAFVNQEPISKEDLEFLLVAQNEHINQVLAQSSHTPVWVLEKLAVHKNFNVKIKVARNPHVPVKLLKKMYQTNSHPSILNAIGGNPNTPVPILEALIAQNIETGVAENPSTPVTLLEKLYANPEWIVRQALANNPSSPLEILIKLAEEETYAIGVAANPSVTTQMLEEWVQTGGGLILESVAINPSSPETVLLKVLERSFEFKSTRNRSKPSGDRIREELANNKSTTSTVLDRLAQDNEPVIRQIVATHQNVAFSTLIHLLNDQDEDVVQLASDKILGYSPESLKQKLKEINFVLDGIETLPKDWVIKVLKDFNYKK